MKTLIAGSPPSMFIGLYAQIASQPRTDGLKDSTLIDDPPRYGKDANEALLMWQRSMTLSEGESLSGLLKTTKGLDVKRGYKLKIEAAE